MRRKWRTIEEALPEPDSWVLLCMTDDSSEIPSSPGDYELVKYLAPEGAEHGWEDKTGDRWHCKDDDYWIGPPQAPIKKRQRQVKKTSKYKMLNAILSAKPELTDGLASELTHTALLYYVEKLDHETVVQRLNEIVPKTEGEYTIKDVVAYLGRVDRMLYIELLKYLYESYKEDEQDASASSSHSA